MIFIFIQNNNLLNHRSEDLLLSRYVLDRLYYKIIFVYLEVDSLYIDSDSVYTSKKPPDMFLFLNNLWNLWEANE